jgi:hypothetical protein
VDNRPQNDCLAERISEEFEKETRKQGNKETRKQGNKETRKQGNKETRKQGNKETRKQGNEETKYINRRLHLKITTIIFDQLINLQPRNLRFHPQNTFLGKTLTFPAQNTFLGKNLDIL